MAREVLGVHVVATGFSNGTRAIVSVVENSDGAGYHVIDRFHATITNERIDSTWEKPPGITGKIHFIAYAEGSTSSSDGIQDAPASDESGIQHHGGLEESQVDQVPPEWDEDDLTAGIARLQKPGLVMEWWNKSVFPNRLQWSGPLSLGELSYLGAFGNREGTVKLSVVRPETMTPQQITEAEKIYGKGDESLERFSDFAIRRGIVNHYIYTHEATINLLLGSYRLLRDANPIHFSFERGWQFASEREMMTEIPVSRFVSATEFFTYLFLEYGASKMFSFAKSYNSLPKPGPRTVSENANFAQTTYRNKFSVSKARLFTFETGSRFSGWTVDQLAEYLKKGMVSPRNVPIHFIEKEGRQLILNTRSAQALIQAGVPRSQWFGLNCTGEPLYESLLTGQLLRNGQLKGNVIKTEGFPSVRRSSGNN
jgi:hypothetical protein